MIHLILFLTFSFVLAHTDHCNENHCKTRYCELNIILDSKNDCICPNTVSQLITSSNGEKACITSPFTCTPVSSKYCCGYSYHIDIDQRKCISDCTCINNVTSKFMISYSSYQELTLPNINNINLTSLLGFGNAVNNVNINSNTLDLINLNMAYTSSVEGTISNLAASFVTSTSGLNLINNVLSVQLRVYISNDNGDFYPVGSILTLSPSLTGVVSFKTYLYNTIPVNIPISIGSKVLLSVFSTVNSNNQYLLFGYGSASMTIQ